MAITVSTVRVSLPFEKYREQCSQGTIDETLFTAQQSLAAAILNRLVTTGRIKEAYEDYRKVVLHLPRADKGLLVARDGAVSVGDEAVFARVSEKQVAAFVDIASILSLGLAAGQEDREMLLGILAEALA